MNLLKIAALVLVAVGAIVNYGAKLIVERFKLNEKVNTAEAEELSAENLENYKMTKVIARVKVAGALILIPGVFLIYIAFK